MYIYNVSGMYILSKEILKANFRLWTDAATVVWVVRKEKESEGKESVERSSRCTKSETLFQMICGSRGSKSRLAKAAGAEPAGQMKNCTPLWREAHFQVKMYKTPAPDHFWKLRCRKSSQRCGAKHTLKLKVLKLTVSDHFWELRVEMAEKCTPLWHKAHFEVKIVKGTTCSDHSWTFNWHFLWQV